MAAYIGDGDMTSGMRIAVGTAGAIGMAAAPVVWWLNGPGTAQTATAVVQGIVGIATLLWAVLHHPPASGPVDKVNASGKAKGTYGATAVSGIKQTRGRRSGSATAARTGDATADGPGSSAVSGIDYS